MATPAEIAYTESLRALVGLEAQLSELRGRAVSILSAASFVIGFLAPKGFDPSRNDVLFVGGLVSYAVCAAAAIFVLVPRGNWQFVSDGARLADEVATLTSDDLDSASWQLKMARRFSTRYDKSKPKIDLLLKGVLACVIALAIEVLVFVGLLMTT